MTTMATNNQPNGSPGGSLRARRERERLAVELRVEGCTFAEIGAQLGVSDRMASPDLPPGDEPGPARARRPAHRPGVGPPGRTLGGDVAADAGRVRPPRRGLRPHLRAPGPAARLDQPARVDANVLANVSVDQLDAEIERLLADYRRGDGDGQA
jgi:hypothetical protein